LLSFIDIPLSIDFQRKVKKDRNKKQSLLLLLEVRAMSSVKQKGRDLRKKKFTDAE